MPCHAMHPIQDLFLESFSYVLQFDMHFICTPMWTKFYSYKKWVLHKAQAAGPNTGDGPMLKKKFLSNFKLNLGIWLDFGNLHKEI
jgi:hypothetical protein